MPRLREYEQGHRHRHGRPLCPPSPPKERLVGALVRNRQAGNDPRRPTASFSIPSSCPPARGAAYFSPWPSTHDLTIEASFTPSSPVTSTASWLGRCTKALVVWKMWAHPSSGKPESSAPGTKLPARGLTHAHQRRTCFLADSRLFLLRGSLSRGYLDWREGDDAGRKQPAEDRDVP
jgi:hypothetical protein